MFPRALQELLQSSPRQPPSDAICLIPRCSNQGSCGRLSSVSLTHMVFHDSLFLSVSPPSTAAQRGCIQAGPENRDRLTATTAAMPRGSGWQSSGVTQVEKSFSSALIRMHPFLPSQFQGKPAGSRKAAACRGTLVFEEQHSCPVRARRAPHKGRPHKVRNMLADPCQVPLLG